ncbi:MAG: hypothetical protein RL770_1216 [Pseudomonadota bacterium]
MRARFYELIRWGRLFAVFMDGMSEVRFKFKSIQNTRAFRRCRLA